MRHLAIPAVLLLALGIAGCSDSADTQAAAPVGPVAEEVVEVAAEAEFVAEDVAALEEVAEDEVAQDEAAVEDEIAE
ncbi:MAG: hypothetical protein ACK4SX_15465 [Alcanivoracaceae bacterium]